MQLEPTPHREAKQVEKRQGWEGHSCSQRVAQCSVARERCQGDQDGAPAKHEGVKDLHRGADISVRDCLQTDMCSGRRIMVVMWQSEDTSLHITARSQLSSKACIEVCQRTRVAWLLQQPGLAGEPAATEATGCCTWIRAALRIVTISACRSSETRLIYGSSQAYSLMACKPQQQWFVSVISQSRQKMRTSLSLAAELHAHRSAAQRAGDSNEPAVLIRRDIQEQAGSTSLREETWAFVGGSILLLQLTVNIPFGAACFGRCTRLPAPSMQLHGRFEHCHSLSWWADMLCPMSPTKCRMLSTSTGDVLLRIADLDAGYDLCDQAHTSVCTFDQLPPHLCRQRAQVDRCAAPSCSGRSLAQTVAQLCSETGATDVVKPSCCAQLLYATLAMQRLCCGKSRTGLTTFPCSARAAMEVTSATLTQRLQSHTLARRRPTHEVMGIRPTVTMRPAKAGQKWMIRMSRPITTRICRAGGSAVT